MVNQYFSSHLTNFICKTTAGGFELSVMAEYPIRLEIINYFFIDDK